MEELEKWEQFVKTVKIWENFKKMIKK